MMKLALNPNYGLYQKDGQAFCDSLQIAETFGRRHSHVIRAVEKLAQPTSGLSEQFRNINFKCSYYKDSSGKRNKRYLLTKDGFVMVAMEFKTKKARAFKEAYIQRFNEMENYIELQKEARLELPAFTEAVKGAYQEARSYHFSNEINMINRIVLGMDSRQFREARGIGEGVSLRSCLEALQLQAIEELQRLDTGLLMAGVDFETRKQTLQKVFAKKYLPLAMIA